MRLRFGNITILVIVLSLALGFLCLKGLAQDFQNGGLEADEADAFDTPEFWYVVPSTDAICFEESTPSPDICTVNGPAPELGAFGTPYEGNSFVAGAFHHSVDLLFIHEGIMQTVSGFELDTQYAIVFQQSNKKASVAQDISGRWRVYANAEHIGDAQVSISMLDWSNVNNQWDERYVNFTAQEETLTIKFMPDDIDGSLLYDPANEIYQGVYMGIDDIWIHECEPFSPEIIQDGNILLYDDPDVLYPAWVDCDTGDVVEYDDDLNMEQSGVYQLTGEAHYCQFATPCTEYTFVSVAELTKSRYRVYPNPANTSVVVEVKYTDSSELNIQTLEGKIVENHQLEAGQNTIDVSHLPPGIYLFESLSRGWRNVDRLVIE